MSNPINEISDEFNPNNLLTSSHQSNNQSQPLNAEENSQDNSENENIKLKQKVKYYEKHLSALLSKFQETTNKFIIFRDFFLKNQTNETNDVNAVLKEMNSFQKTEENSQISSLIEENSQLRINFKRSTDLLKQQKEIIHKLKNSNKELNSVLEMISKKETSNQRVEELEKENKDLQSLYEMMVIESDELNSKNQALRNQIDNYKANEDKLRKEQKKLQQKIHDIEEDLVKALQLSSDVPSNTNLKIKNSNKTNNSKAALDISSSISFNIPEELQNEIQVRFPLQKSDGDSKRLIEELEVKSNYLESELDKTTENLNKIIKQNDILKQDHKKHWINLKNAKNTIDQYKEIEKILRGKLESAGIEIPKYDNPVFEEV